MSDDEEYKLPGTNRGASQPAPEQPPRAAPEQSAAEQPPRQAAQPAPASPERKPQAKAESAPVEAAAMNELKAPSKPAPQLSGDMSLDMILDVNVSLSIELGRVGMSIRDLLQLNQGSIVELERMAGEPLDVLVNGTLVARGEVVVVKDRFGLMLTEVVSPEERVRRLH